MVQYYKEFDIQSLHSFKNTNNGTFNGASGSNLLGYEIEKYEHQNQFILLQIMCSMIFENIFWSSSEIISELTLKISVEKFSFACNLRKLQVCV